MTDNRLTQFNVADAGLIIKNTSTGDNKPSILSLESNEAAVETGETIGSLNFKASGETTDGGDAIEVCAGIDAVAEADFTSSVNSTKLSFKTGSSEAAAEKMALSSNGNLQLVGTESSIKIKEISNAISDTSGYGQLWVDLITPNELYFTNDAGTDIQITSGSSLASGGGGGSSDLNSLSDVLVENNSLFIGHDPSSTTSSASSNLAVGTDTMSSITTGNTNTAVGFQAGKNLKTGFMSTFIGYNSCKGASGKLLGNYNTCVGSETLPEFGQPSTTSWASWQTALGFQSGYSRGESIGALAAAGYRSGYSDTSTSCRSVYMGSQAGYSVTTGKYITLVGHQAGYNVTGNYNTIIGSLGGNTGTNNLTTGTNNTLIGYNAEATSSSMSNRVILGNSSISTLRCNTTSVTVLSDKRDKKDIQDSSYGLEFINKLKPVQFTWNTRNGCDKDGTSRLGFIAQDIQNIMNDNDNDILKLVDDENEEKLQITPSNLLPIIVKAIKDIRYKNNLLKEKLKNNGYM